MNLFAPKLVGHCLAFLGLLDGEVESFEHVRRRVLPLVRLLQQVLQLGEVEPVIAFGLQGSFDFVGPLVVALGPGLDGRQHHRQLIQSVAVPGCPNKIVYA